tara:strand:- start:98 stop:268 length:171 start_codon:yes stop_codon:yes gene_type:complete
MIKITNYTKSEIVEIQYGEDPTSYIYREEDHNKLTKELLRIMETGKEVKIITKEYI